MNKYVEERPDILVSIFLGILWGFFCIISSLFMHEFGDFTLIDKILLFPLWLNSLMDTFFISDYYYEFEFFLAPLFYIVPIIGGILGSLLITRIIFLLKRVLKNTFSSSV